jgi:hypothetical protein
MAREEIVPVLEPMSMSAKEEARAEMISVVRMMAVKVPTPQVQRQTQRRMAAVEATEPRVPELMATKKVAIVTPDAAAAERAARGHARIGKTTTNPERRRRIVVAREPIDAARIVLTPAVRREVAVG